MTDELKPCPFCGSYFTDKYFDGACDMVICRNCCHSWDYETWNTRPIEDALTARVAELEAERRWIAFDKQYPPPEGHYIAKFEDDPKHPVGEATFTSGVWLTHTRAIPRKVTHWMPLPEPPEE